MRYHLGIGVGADAGLAGERLARKPRLQIAELALGAPPHEIAAFQRGDTCGIVAAIFEPLERVDQQWRNRLTPENAHDSAHPTDRSPLILQDQYPARVYRS